MATTADFKNGLVLVIDGQLWTITEFQHVKTKQADGYYNPATELLEANR